MDTYSLFLVLSCEVRHYISIKMEIPVYVADAFASEPFTGNPAAVCLLESWPGDELLQKIAAENNLAETAFLVRADNGYYIRWFTPKTEVVLCGHATLASGHVLFNHMGYENNEITFQSLSGLLKIKKEGDSLTLDFPADKIAKAETPDFLKNAFGSKPLEVWKGNIDYLFLFMNQQQIEDASPKLDLIAQSGTRGIIITAPGNDCDFVSRYFAPQCGINEDPATGSAHTTLAVYWHGKTGKTKTTAIQLSERKGFFSCHLKGDRVEISGKAFTYSKGTIML
jgi:PhzF family phenazine biosynthesis protein